MTRTDTARTVVPGKVSAPAPRRREGLIGLLMRLDAAWRQKRHLDRLTEAERRDMGMSEEAREATTLADLAARKRRR